MPFGNPSQRSEIDSTQIETVQADVAQLDRTVSGLGKVAKDAASMMVYAEREHSRLQAAVDALAESVHTSGLATSGTRREVESITAQMAHFDSQVVQLADLVNTAMLRVEQMESAGEYSRKDYGSRLNALGRGVSSLSERVVETEGTLQNLATAVGSKVSAAALGALGERVTAAESEIAKLKTRVSKLEGRVPWIGMFEFSLPLISGKGSRDVAITWTPTAPAADYKVCAYVPVAGVSAVVVEDTKTANGCVVKVTNNNTLALALGAALTVAAVN